MAGQKMTEYTVSFKLQSEEFHKDFHYYKLNEALAKMDSLSKENSGRNFKLCLHQKQILVPR